MLIVGVVRVRLVIRDGGRERLAGSRRIEGMVCRVLTVWYSFSNCEL